MKRAGNKRTQKTFSDKKRSCRKQGSPPPLTQIENRNNKKGQSLTVQSNSYFISICIAVGRGCQRMQNAFNKFKSDFDANGDINQLQQQLVALKVFFFFFFLRLFFFFFVVIDLFFVFFSFLSLSLSLLFAFIDVFFCFFFSFLSLSLFFLFFY